VVSVHHAPCNSRRRTLAAWRLALARRLALAPRPLAGRRTALAVERERRDLAGMPWRHPENLTRGLRGRHERRLKVLAAELWPADEYEMEL
jgi:hypothetical protein